MIGRNVSLNRPPSDCSKMPTPWTAWRRMLSCKVDIDRGVVHDSQVAANVSKWARPTTMLHSRRSSGSLCSKACSSLKDVIHGNARVVHRADIGSPFPFENGSYRESFPREAVFKSPRPENQSSNPSKTMHLRKFSGCYDCSVASRETQDVLLAHSQSVSRVASANYSQTACEKCGEVFSKTEALGQHHATQHKVTELKESDSARNIVEIIFQTSWLKDSSCGKIERVLKVQNSSKTIAKFEEYRDMVKAKANKLPRKHPRCIADGNELLRFYCTTISCQLATSAGSSSSSTLCTSSSCKVCEILRQGFPLTRGQGWIYTTASSGKADDRVQRKQGQEAAACNSKEKRAMLVCRVIAGRVKKIYQDEDSSQDDSFISSGFDSVAGEATPYTNLEELLVFNPKAVLPCFVVIYGSDP